MASNNVMALTEDNFDKEVLQSTVPVLVDFTATWCGPCKVLAPVIDKVADEFVGKVKVGKVDADNAPAITARYGVRSLPTVMVFKGGERVAQHVGSTNREGLIKLIQTEG